MTIVWLLLRKWWKEIAILLVFVGIYFYWLHLTDTIADQQKEIATLTTANTTLKGNVDKLTATVDDNNKAITALAAGTSQTLQGFAALTTTVNSRTGNLAAQLKGILSEKKPQTCDDTIKYLIQAAPGYHK